MKSLFKCCLTVLLSLPVILACQISRDITTNQDRETADRMPSSMGEGNTIRHHHLEIHIDPASGTISISDLVEFHLDSEEVKVDLHENMQIQSLTYGSEPLEFVVEPHDKGLNSVVIQVPKERIGESFQARFQYSGSIPKVDFSDGRHRGVEVAPYLNSDEAVLLSNGHWYPVISEQKSLITYSLTVHTPPGWETISAGTKIQQDPALFEMGHPIDDINLISGRFHVKKGTAGNVGLMTYFKKEDPDMEKKYLSAMKAHLEEFETRFGAYPYESLSLVASPLMEGIGFPGFIMMGERLLSIRNMERISLGHEILHNWWGNGVYPDWEEGNWTEGLITYLVDHAFSVRKIGKPGARAELIEGYSLYTQTGKEPSLTEFKQRERPQDMAVGYYKAAFVFSMLEDHLGKDRFDQALRNFRDAMMFKVASWNDLESAFDATSEDSLNDFFERWVQGVGAPEIRILEAHIVSGSGGREVELILASDPVFQIQLPITITSATSTTPKGRHLEEFETRFGAYPYESLSLVASPLMEGIGFPGFIMMGERLLSIRNMERISLGHEILHNWWGNGVYPDWEEGNWTEGLITYLVDHAFSVRKIGKPGARAELIEGYSLYTQTGKEPSLTEFKQRERPQDMAVGYYKAAFVFSMLEDHLGKDRFDQALRNFRDAMMFKVASWNDLESAFDATSEDSLNDFFERWVQGVGAPEIRILEAHIVSGSGGREVELILASDPVFQIQLPITITSATSTTQEKVTISRSPQTIRLKAATAIRTIKVDPEYSVLRKFLPEELPITLSSALEEDIDLPVVFSSSLNKEQVAIYKHFLQVSQVVYHQVDTVSETMGPVVIMGYPSASGEIGGWVPKDVPWKWAGSSLSIGDATISRGKDTAAFAWRGPKGASQPVAWIVGYSREGLESLSMRLGYFLSSSYVMLQEGKKPVRDEWKSDAKPLEIEFADAKPDQV